MRFRHKFESACLRTINFYRLATLDCKNNAKALFESMHDYTTMYLTFPVAQSVFIKGHIKFKPFFSSTQLSLCHITVVSLNLMAL